MKSQRRVQTRVHPANQPTLLRLSKVLRKGGLVAVPSETVYGLAANALDPLACAGIFAAKGRPANDPLIVHAADLSAAQSVAHFNPWATALARAFWPGPLTLVLPKRECIPPIVTSGKSTVAIRVPAHPVFQTLLRTAGLPLAAPSANPFGGMSPTTASHVVAGLGGRIAHVIDGGASAVGVESTIVDVSNPRRPRLLRPGGLSRESIERVLGRRLLGPPRSGDKGTGPAAPGLLPWHYSPTTPCRLVPANGLVAAIREAPPGTLYLRFGSASRFPSPLRRRGISLPLKDTAAARELFSSLQRLDAKSPPLLLISLPSKTTGGLWPAIVDRLTRAAARPKAADRGPATTSSTPAGSRG